MRNVELLRKAADRIEHIPESYSQVTYYGQSDSSPCGTVACLAGEIIIASESTTELGVAKLKELYEGMDALDTAVFDEAIKLAGLTEAEGLALFPMTVSGWPEPYKSQYREAYYAPAAQAAQLAKAKAAAGLLRHLADGGKMIEEDA